MGGGGGGGGFPLTSFPYGSNVIASVHSSPKCNRFYPFNSLATGFKLEIIEGQGWGWKNRSDASHHVSPSPLGLPLPPLLRK